MPSFVLRQPKDIFSSHPLMTRIVILLVVICSILGQSTVIHWGRCPQLEPMAAEKLEKIAILENCVKRIPFPRITQTTKDNETRQLIDDHRERIAFCSLDSQQWFTPKGSYNFTKAREAISKKNFPPEIVETINKHHWECESEATEKFPNLIATVVKTVQLYQACMEYYISRLCDIRFQDN